MLKHEFINSSNAPPTWIGGLMSPRRRRSLILAVAFVLLLLITHLSSSSSSSVPSTSNWREYSYVNISLKHGGSSPSPQPTRLTLETLLEPTHPLVRYLNDTSKNFEPEYVYSYTLGRGYEGEADIYTHVPTGQTVVIKSFFSTTRTQTVPKPVFQRLKSEYNVTSKQWPVDITATLRRYNNNTLARSGEDLTVHAIDAFYVPSNKPGVQSLPWRMVLPLYKSGSLDYASGALSYLNVSTADVDFLYRPRYRAVFEGLARMHTTINEELNFKGYCHDDIKIDNIFLRNESHEMLLGDLGQTRPLRHEFHRHWQDCRLVDAHRAWKTYLILLRDSSARNHGPSEFNEQLMSHSTEWAKAYRTWLKKPTLPEKMLAPETTAEPMEERRGFWDTTPQGTIMFPVLKNGVIVRVPLGRDKAIAELEKIRREYATYKKAKQAGIVGNWRPWWLWDMPGVPVNKMVDKELKVIDGAQLVGM